LCLFATRSLIIVRNPKLHPTLPPHLSVKTCPARCHYCRV